MIQNRKILFGISILLRIVWFSMYAAVGFSFFFFWVKNNSVACMICSVCIGGGVLWFGWCPTVMYNLVRFTQFKGFRELSSGTSTTLSFQLSFPLQEYMSLCCAYGINFFSRLPIRCYVYPLPILILFRVCGHASV